AARAGAETALEGELAPVQLDARARDRHAEPRPVGFGRVEEIERPRDRLIAHACPGVLDRHGDRAGVGRVRGHQAEPARAAEGFERVDDEVEEGLSELDRKSTRLNSSHEWISYAVFCLKKKKETE